MTSLPFKLLDPLNYKNRNEWRLIYRGDWIHMRSFLNYKIKLKRF